MFLRFPKIKLRDEIPKSEQRKRYIVSGYRQSQQPWSYYVLSLFQIHNESVNIWTHLIAFVWMIYVGVRLAYTYDFSNNPLTHPLGAGLLGLSSMFLGSTIAHWFSNVSDLMEYTAFFLDYMGISLFGVGATILMHSYSVKDSNMRIFLQSYSQPVNLIINLLMFTVYCYCKLFLGRNNRITKVTKVVSNLSSYFWSLLPVVQRMFHGDADGSTITTHKIHVICYLLSGVFYSCHIPERWFPKSFDIIGQSHQIFHILIWSATYFLVEATLQDFENAGKMLHASEGTYGLLFIIFLMELFILVWFYNAAKNKVHATDKSA